MTKLIFLHLSHSGHNAPLSQGLRTHGTLESVHGYDTVLPQANETASEFIIVIAAVLIKCENSFLYDRRVFWLERTEVVEEMLSKQSSVTYS